MQDEVRVVQWHRVHWARLGLGPTAPTFNQLGGARSCRLGSALKTMYCTVVSASLAIRIAEQSAYVTDHVVPRLSVRMYVCE